MVKLPSVRQLQYFVSLEEQQHFGRAAEQCCVSQSAFSNAIAELESTLGTRLVDRTNRRVTITSLGREVAAQARLCLREVEALVAIARDNAQPLCGRLTLGVIPTIGPFLLPGMLTRLRQVFPDLQLYLREQRSAELYRELLEGSVDLILMAIPYPMKGVEIQALFRDYFLLACHARTRLLDPDCVSIDDLDPETVLLLEEGHCLRDHALAACHIDQLQQVNRFAATSLPTLLEMVAADLGVTFVPDMARRSTLLRGSEIATYPLAEESYREIALVWRQGSGRSEAFTELGDFIREHGQS